jgi:hypothetical protein
MKAKATIVSLFALVLAAAVVSGAAFEPLHIATIEVDVTN